MELSKHISYKGKCNSKRFSDGDVVSDVAFVEYGVADDANLSFVNIKWEEGDTEIKLSVDLLQQVYGLMTTVDPFSFAFNEEEDKEA